MKDIHNVMDETEEMADVVDNLSSELVAKYCMDLDEYMNVIDTAFAEAKEPPVTETLELYALNLSSILYFTGEAQESIGIREDICKSIKNEIYSKTKAMTKGTVAEREAAAVLASQQETLTLSIYSRAYKKIKLKMETASEMLNSIKKVLTRRIAEAELSNNKFNNKIGEARYI